MGLYLAIAIGGSMGAVARFWIMSFIGRINPDTFPWSTLTVNVLGAFLLGTLIEAMALAWSPSEELRALLVVGFLGALTTFSAFTLDVMVLYERGQMMLASIYVFSSCFACLLAFWLALRLVRIIFA